MTPIQSSSKSERLPFVLLVKAYMDQLDEIAVLLKQGHPAALSRELLREMGTVLPDLSEQQQTIYFDTLLALSDSFGAQRIEKISSDYEESVATAKRRFVEYLREKLVA